MVKRMVDFALSQRLVSAALGLLLIAVGAYSYSNLPIEAFPDPDDVHVQVITLWPGQAAEEVESLVTRPTEQQLNGTPGLTALRSVSMFGLSVVTLTFEDGVEDNFARAQVLEKMQAVSLPPSATWQLAALTTSTGEVFRYVIEATSASLEEVRAVQDWVVEPGLRQVPSVADVVAFGGAVKQFQVYIRPELLAQHKVTLTQVTTALAANNLNVGGGTLVAGEQSLVIRGVGILSNVDEIRRVVVATNDGRPVYISDVGTVRTGQAPRQGIAGFFQRGDEGKPNIEIDDVVEGIVLQRKGANALEVVKGIRAKIDDLNAHAMPKGMKLVPIYERTELVRSTVKTVMKNLAEGAVLVILILLIFTGSIRGAAVVATVIPLSLLCALIFLFHKGVPANLLSFGAVDFGMIVDSAVVVVEAILVKRILHPEMSSDHVAGETTAHLGRAILFAKLIIITAMLPIFTFERVEGRIFRPMAMTIAAAIIGATILTVTLVPLLSAVFFKNAKPSKGPNFVVRFVLFCYDRLLRFTLANGLLTVTLAGLLLAGSLVIGSRMGTEFLPKLDEGNIWLTTTMPLSISQDEGKATERRIREILKSFPESRMIYTQLGRPDDGTDPKGNNSLEIAIYLPPHEKWTTTGPDGKVVDKEGLIALINARLQELPGLEFNFSQIIEDNVEEALSGVKGELAIKLFGDDLGILQSKGEEVRKVLAAVPGVADLAVERLSGQPNLNIKLRRDAIARYGLDAQTVLGVVDAGLAGRPVGSIVEKQRRFDLVVRFDSQDRTTPERIASLWVDTPSGQRIPLSELAEIKVEDGASRISRDRNSRRIALKCGIRGRDMGSFVAEAQERVRSEIQLPEGYSITWEGQFENQQRAMKRMMIVVPVSLLLIIALLFAAFGSLRYALLIILNVPLALIGGIVLLFATGTHLSVSAMIGFIALSGVCVQNGLILVGQFNSMRAGGMPLREAVINGARARVRPVLMTALMAAIGMYPAAVSHGIGSEVQRPLALVILGGMISAAALTLLVLPVVYFWLEDKFPTEVKSAEGFVD